MRLNPLKIKDVERLQRYERIINDILKKREFSRADIWPCGESKRLIGRIINVLLSEGAIIERGKDHYKWIDKKREEYKKQWQRPISVHQIKRLSREERPREKLLKYGSSKLTNCLVVPERSVLCVPEVLKL